MDGERRSWLRFRTVLPVVVESEAFGSIRGIARNVSKGGLCVEVREPLPLNTAVRVWFVSPDGTRISATGQVKNHYTFNFSGGQTRPRCLRGMGVRFADFEGVGERALSKALARLTAAGSVLRCTPGVPAGDPANSSANVDSCGSRLVTGRRCRFRSSNGGCG